MGKIDIAIILIIALFTVIGLFKGFMKQVLSVANWLVSLVGSFLLLKPVAAVLGKTALSTSINNKVANWISTKGDIFSQPLVTEQAGEQIAQGISELGLPKFIAEAISGWFKVSGTEGEKTLADVLAPAIGNIILTVIAFIALFIVLLIIFKIISGMLNNIVDNGILGALNKLLGGALGFIKGAVLVSIVMLLLSALSGVIPALNDFLVSDLKLGTDGFGIGKFFYEKNPLLGLLKGSFNFKEILSSFTFH